MHQRGKSTIQLTDSFFESDSLVKKIHHSIWKRKSRIDLILYSLAYLILIGIVSSFFVFLSYFVQRTHRENTENLIQSTYYGSFTIQLRGLVGAVLNENACLQARASNIGLSEQTYLLSQTQLKLTHDSAVNLYRELVVEFNRPKYFDSNLLHFLLSEEVLFLMETSRRDQKGLPPLKHNIMSAFTYTIDLTSKFISLSQTFRRLLALPQSQQIQPEVDASIQLLSRTVQDTASKVLVNSFEETMPVISRLLERLKKILTEQQPRAYNKIFTAFVSVFLVLTFLNCLFFVCIQMTVNGEMNSMLSAYILMSPEDLEVNYHIAELNLDLFENNKFDETEMVAIYFSRSGILPKNTMKEIQEKEHKSNVRVKSLIRDKYHRSASLGIAFSVFLTCLISSMAVVCFPLNAIVNKTFQVQDILMQHFVMVNDICDRQAHFRLFGLFGDYIQMDGQFVSQNLFAGAIEHFTDYWIEIKGKHSLVVQQGLDQIEQMLTGDICAYLGDANDFELAAKRACNRQISMSSAQGITYFLIQADDLDERKKTTFNISHSLQIAASKEQLSLIGLDAYFSELLDSYRLVEDQTLAVFFKRTSQILKQNSDKYFEEIVTSILSLRLLFSLSISFVIFMLSAALLYFSTHDWEVCYETFKTIDSETVSSNALINSSFRKFFKI